MQNDINDNQACSEIDEAINQLAKEYSLNETEKTFISWYAKLNQRQRNKIFPILMESANSAPYEQVNIPILRHFQMPKTISTSLFS